VNEVAQLTGREAELKSLAKLLNLAKTGEPKSVLISGAPGIGKTTLVQAFLAKNQNGHYCRQIALALTEEDTPETLYVSLIEALQADAGQLLDEGLAATAPLTQELGLEWTRADLMKAVSLVKIQESLNRSVKQDQLIKAIRSAIPALKKLKLSVNGTIEQLVQILINPWLSVACQLIQPYQPPLDEAVKLADQLRQHPHSEVPIDTLITHWVNTLFFVNQLLQGQETALVVALDHWDTLLDNPRCADFQNLMSVFLREMSHRKGLNLLFVLACRSDGESYTLSGGLFNLFRHKLLLTGLSQPEATQLFGHASPQLMPLTHGNPYWIQTVRRLLPPDATLETLALTRAEDVLPFRWTRVKMTFLEGEHALLQTVAALLAYPQPFEIPPFMEDWISRSGLEPDQVFDVLRVLYEEHFIVQCGPEPSYRLESRLMAAFLARQTEGLTHDWPKDEKLKHLKQVLPLSVLSGELTREKAFELLRLGQELGKRDDVLEMLVSVCQEALQQPLVLTRLTAVNILAGLPIAKATLLEASLQDSSELIREYALRHLLALPLMPELIESVLARIDDDSDAVRALAYAYLRQASGVLPEVSTLYLKGLVDGNETIRCLSAAALETEHSVEVRHQLLLATQDPSLAVRQQACRSLANFDEPDVQDRVRTLLVSDPSPTVRMAAAETLNRFHTQPERLDWLQRALQHESEESVQVAMIKAIATLPEAEDVIMTWVERGLTRDPLPAALIWSGLTALMQMGQSITVFQRLQALQVEDALLVVGIRRALKAIQGRLVPQAPALPDWSLPEDEVMMPV
jgi:Cdc6-like AAA superfamily ATPase